MADDVGVIRIFHNKVLLMSGKAVMGVQCDQKGAEYTALRGSGVEHQSGGGVTANLKCLVSACEESQFPVESFMVDTVLNAQVKSTNSIHHFVGGSQIDGDNSVIVS